MYRNSWKRLKQVLFIPLVGTAIAFFGEATLAQSNIVPDKTLGDESSQVRADEIKGNPAEIIEGGAQRETNLFHSFSEFNVENGRGAYFANPTGIENIFSRVTGSNLSEIFGTLGVSGNANLFLINSNGIIFGENARLDVGGSFVGTTADGVQFGETGKFSATEPDAPPLLTVKPSALFFNQVNPGRIENRSTATAGNSLSGEPLSGLRVSDGNNLLLVGGDVNIDGGGLNALGGRVELGGLAATGTVGLDINDNNLSLSFPEEVRRADVFLTNGARVDVTAGGGGSIFVNANNLELAEGSLLLAGIEAGSGTSNAKAGNIILNATEEISLSQASAIANHVEETAIGNGGDIEIVTGSLTLKENKTKVTTETFGEGNAGDVKIKAKESVLLEGKSNRRKPTAIASLVRKNARGDAGNVELETSSLILKDGSFMSATTQGQGNAGNVRIQANSVLVEGESSKGKPTDIASRVMKNARGDGGEVEIQTGSLTLKNGAEITTETLGEGNAGIVNIEARDSVLLEGESSQGNRPKIISRVENKNAIGDGGTVEIDTSSLTLKNAVISASTFGKGNAGSVSIRAQESVLLEGETSRGEGSAIGSRVGENAIGDGGTVEIDTGSLTLKDGATVNTDTLGEGNAGIVSVEARNSVLLEGVSSKGERSSINSRIRKNAKGNGGEIENRYWFSYS